MKVCDIEDYEYEPRHYDLARLFHVEEKTNKNNSVDTFYNLNDGFTIDGVDSLPLESVSTYTCKNNDDLRFISYDLYGTTEYWWLIAKINGIENCLEKLEAGRKLKILKEYYLDIIFEKIREGI